jgi:hypothetical protein
MRFFVSNQEAQMPQPDIDRVKITLLGAEVTPEFRSAIHHQAGRAGMSTTEWVLRAAAQTLIERGEEVPGLYSVGDIDEVRI